jgi:hypothetical protein
MAKSKPSFSVELPPPIQLPPPPASSADRLAVLLGGAQPAQPPAPPALQPPVVGSPAAPSVLEPMPAIMALPDDTAGELEPAKSLIEQEVKPTRTPKRKPRAANFEPAPAIRTHVRKRDGAELRRLHLRLPVDLARQLDFYCVENDRPVAGDVVIEALRQFLQ